MDHTGLTDLPNHPKQVQPRVVRWTKLLVRPYLLQLKKDHPGVVLVTGDLDGPSEQYVCAVNDVPLVSIVKNSSLSRQTTEQVRT